MAEVLETPVKKKPGKNQALPTGCSSGLPPSRRTEASAWSSPPGLELPRGLGLQQGGVDPLSRLHPRGCGTAGNKLSKLATVQGDPSSGGERGKAGPDGPLRTSATTATHLTSAKPRQTSPASLPAFLPTTMSLGNSTQDPYLQQLPGAGSLGKTGGPADTVLRGPRFVIRETPVRDEGESDWSSDTGSTTARERRQQQQELEGEEEFGRMTPDMSDVTVYNELAKMPPASVPSAKRTCREPTPGSEGPRGTALGHPHHKAVFSALRQYQQDSGIHSPFSHHK